MAKVMLTEAQKLKNRLTTGDRVLVRCLNHYKVDQGMKWTELAQQLHVGSTTLSRWRDRPGAINLDQARKMAVSLRMTPEEWLRIGGFTP